MATSPTRRAIAPMRGWQLVVLCALLACLLPAVWVGVGVQVLRARTAGDMAAAAQAVQVRFDALWGRIAKTTELFSAADARAANRIALAARMLHLETRLAPAENLFLYDASGHFVAATVPLLPGDEMVRRSAWFRAAAAAIGQTGGESGGLVVFGPAREPLGEAQGFIVMRPLVGPGGRFAGAVGTFVRSASIRELLASTHLPPGSQVALSRAAGGETVLQFSVPDAREQEALAPGLPWVGQLAPASATISLPGGLEWQATASAFSGTTMAEWRAIWWGAALVAAGPLFLLATFGFRRRHPERPADAASDPAPAACPAEPPRAESDWMWEIDADGLLVGVGGNASKLLVKAVGANLFDLIGSDPKSAELRDAMVRRVPVRHLALEVVLPGDAAGARHRFSLTGYPVGSTGGFWGTAGEVAAMAEPGADFPDPHPADPHLADPHLADLYLVDREAAQASVVSANAPSMRPSSVRPRRLASALRWAASM